MTEEHLGSGLGEMGDRAEVTTEGPPAPTDVPTLTKATSRSRERSTVQFPYDDLGDAIEIVEAIAGYYGSQCSLDQLAAHLKHDSITSGSFRSKMGTARMFGVVTVDGHEVTLTDLGRRLIQPVSATQSKVEAFLNVQLYKQIYEMYRGHALPFDVGLEREMQRFGVASKQTDKARQAFQRSAEVAGFFAHGRDRLIAPGAAAPALEAAKASASGDTAQTTQPGGPAPGRPPTSIFGTGGNGEQPPINPFILGLFQTLPPPGASWPVDKRKHWLQTAEYIFAIIYGE